MLMRQVDSIGDGGEHRGYGVGDSTGIEEEELEVRWRFWARGELLLTSGIIPVLRTSLSTRVQIRGTPLL